MDTTIDVFPPKLKGLVLWVSILGTLLVCSGFSHC
jgi:hypothetical protein